MKKVLYLLIIAGLTGCNTDKKKSSSLFEPVAPDFNNRTVTLPKGFNYTVLFSEGDSVVNATGKVGAAKGSQDMVVYIPINNSNEHGWLYVNHEEHKPNALLGDGGGGSVFEIEKINNQWKVKGTIRSVDFSGVGQTFRNCGGTLTPYGTILTTEEEFPQSNTEIMERFGITDTSDYNGKKKYLNYGWIVEVDPASGKALRKIKSFGRYRHEDVQCMPDKKTVYLTHDDQPSILFKFVAEKENDYSAGQLYAYHQLNNGTSGEWIALPMHEDSLADAVNVALRRHATMFVSTEWIEAAGNRLYITESGSRKFNFDKEVAMGGEPAYHLYTNNRTEGNNYADPYGRLLAIDLTTLQTDVVINGGVSPADSLFCFASPDAMTSATINGKQYLIISEDSQGYLNGKASAEVTARNETYNEVYFLDLSIQQPTINDLQRFMMAPEGCETTGNMFTPDGKTYFVSIQHPSAGNPVPFNKSSVIAITGF